MDIVLMFRDHGEDEVVERMLAREEDHRSRMHLYLVCFLIAVAVVEQLGHHFLS